MAECREFPGRGKVVRVRPAGAEVGTRLHGAIFGRICGTWASAGRSFALASQKGGLTVTMGRGWDEGLARSSAFEGGASSGLTRAVCQGYLRGAMVKTWLEVAPGSMRVVEDVTTSLCRWARSSRPKAA